MKKKYIAAILAFFLGGLGVHKFYLGKSQQGIIYLLFCWTYIPTFLGVIDCLMILSMSDDSFYEKYQIDEPYYTSYENKDSRISQREEDNSPLHLFKECPSCGHKNSLENNFCESCGTKLN